MTSYTTSAPGSDPTNVVGRRIGAYVIDLLLMWIIVAAVMVPKFNDEAERVRSFGRTCDDVALGSETFCVEWGDELLILPDSAEADFVRTFYVLAIGLGVANLVVLQGVTGASIGKLIVGLRVVREDGKVANVGWAALRWILLFIDGIICMLLPGIALVASTKGHRRLGDMVASTFVVTRAAAGRPIVVPGLNASVGTYGPGYTPPSYGAPAGWDAGAPTSPPQQPGWGTGPAPQAPNTWGIPSADQPTPPATAQPGADSPTWDPARNAYIQYDRELGSWMQWDDASNAWKPISQ